MITRLIRPEDIEDSLSFSVPFRVKGKARPRFDPRSNRAYMPKAYSLQVQDIQWMLRSMLFEHGNFLSQEHAYAIEIKLVRKRRKPKNKKEALTFDDIIPPGSFAQGKPDWDNAAGTMSDAGSSMLYGDDEQIVLGLVYRVYGEEEGAAITVLKLKPNTRPLA